MSEIRIILRIRLSGIRLGAEGSDATILVITLLPSISLEGI